MSQVNKLLDNWSTEEHHLDQGFIRDGVIDVKRWEEQPQKVMLLLKEAYGAKNSMSGFDLCKVIRDEWKGPKYKIWWNAAYWCFAALSKGIAPPFPATEQSYDAARESLLSSAIVNIKKSNGYSSSDDDDLAAYAKQDGAYIRSQIDLISPDIIICGNTWKFVRHLFPDAKPIFDLAWSDGKRIFVDFWHPANQFPAKQNYYSLAFILNQLQLQI